MKENAKFSDADILQALNDSNPKRTDSTVTSSQFKPLQRRCKNCNALESIEDPLLGEVCSECLRKTHNTKPEKKEAQVPSVAFKEVRKKASTNPSANYLMGDIGVVMVVLGVLVAGYFLFGYETAVSSHSLPDRVHNLGLQQNRYLGSTVGFVMVIVGTIFIAAAKLRDELEKLVDALRKKP